MQTIKFFAILMAAATEVAAESAPSRRLIVNIPERKIALVEDGKVVKMYSVAVGKPSTPSPRGTFHIASHVVNPPLTLIKARWSARGRRTRWGHAG
jgi:murein L,D-transpeptidase YcbB/YkuD